MTNSNKTTLMRFPVNLKDDSYHIPEGDYTGEVIKCGRRDNGEFTIKFKILNYETEENVFIVNSNYSEREEKKLIRHLEHWLGKQFVKEWQQSGEFDFESLVGKRADLVVIVSSPANKYSEGYRSVQDIRPPATLVEAGEFVGAEI